MTTKLDEVDYEIIKVLFPDSRKSYREIRDDLGISIGTIHNRIKKLIEKKVILNFSLNLDYDKLNILKLFNLNEGCQKCAHISVCELYNSLKRRQNLYWNELLKIFFGIYPEELSNYCLKYKEKEVKNEK